MDVDDTDEPQTDICRVCRCEGTSDKPLYHPCVCTGSIKFIHQDCLVQWLKYSRKEFCELCKHRFAFTPIYSPDMPKRLPIKDIVSGLLGSVGKAVRYWFHYTLVTFAWLGVVPLTACRIYRCLFTGSVSSLLTLPLDMLSTENIASDCFHGCFVVACTLCAFISLVWLREQILHGGGPDWLEQDVPGVQQRNPLDIGVVNNLVGLGGGGARDGAANQNNQNEDNNAEAANEGEEEVEEEGADNGNNAAQDDNNWNPIEWDRAAEELTWERLLGLDGSLVFLEHVFWVVSLNTLFILVFAFCPYHIGHFTMIGMKMEDVVEASHFEGLLTTLIGYVVIAFSLIFLYAICSLIRLKRFVVNDSSIIPFPRVLVCVFGCQDNRKVFPGFLPYNVMLSSDAPVSELSLELLLLQVVLPALLEQGHTRMWLKGLVRGWTLCVAWMLNLRSYLVGDVQLDDHDNVIQGDAAAAPAGPPPPPAGNHGNNAPNNPVPPPGQPGGLAAAHQAMLQAGGPIGFQSYKRPNLFYFRIVLLVALMCFTLFAASVVCLILPVFFGRKLMSLWMGEAKIHELYTAACGLYVCWLMLRIGTVLYNWIPQGTAAILNKLKQWLILALKSLFVAVILMGVVPLLLGLLFELVVVAPLRVSLDQTPVFFPWQDWALGVLHTKIICAVTMMGPQWWLKRVIEQVYNDGLRNMNLKFILYKLCFPVIGVLGMSLSVPYVIARSLVPALGFDFDVQNFVLRRIYPFLLACVVMVFVCVFQARQFKRLYEHIKNDKYLVGQRLVNYDPKRFVRKLTTEQTAKQT
ncbi:E3 ubiquitin-protein ligase MARCHF6-like [Ruditapes philippinarum]|uniref:E3 ubiquitin-protein ligase MARCHF6-like n=1 Tax=Ruditapes philippinarum TaxID=129788 RepID=UPI00295AF4DF|nr:E3 ubiquitin-protein ligase MARCHF6-like [Ruditapes philippinarum]